MATLWQLSPCAGPAVYYNKRMKKILARHNEKHSWFQQACTQLETIQREAPKYSDEGEILPRSTDFAWVKEQLSEYSHILKLRKPIISTSEKGAILVVWKGSKDSLHLLFYKGKLTAKFLEGTQPKVIGTGCIPQYLETISRNA